MMALRSTMRRLRRDADGTMAIETAIVAPILLVLALGGVDAGAMVARQSELQSAAAEALNIVQAAPPKNPAQRTTVENILKVSTGIDSPADVAGQDVDVSETFRCGTDTTLVDAETDCDGGDAVSAYIQITLTDTYTPTWTKFGVGSPVNYNVVRTVQIS